MADRPFARTIQNAFEPIVPERHDSGVVDDGHALIEKLEDLYSSTFFIGPRDVRGVCAVSEIERHGRDHRHFPLSLVDHRRKSHGDGRANGITRHTVYEVYRPRSIDWPLRDKRHNDVGRNAFYRAPGEYGERDRQALCRPREAANRAAGGLVDRAR